MKRILAMLLALMSLCLMGCQTVSQGETNDTTQNTQSPEEEKVMRILNISNSHGADSVKLLPMVLQAEMPDQEFFVAELYASYALTEHVEAAKEDAKDYVYYTNGDGTWNRVEGVSISMALQDQHWDVIMFNESSRHLGLEKYMSKGLIDWFRSYILDNLDYEPTLLYNMTWSNPTDERFHDPSSDRQKPPETFRKSYTVNYGFNYITHYNMLVEMTKKYLVGHEGFDKIIYNAKPVQYAQVICGVPQWDDAQKMDLYRDYTHLSDFARLMVAYNWYAQMFDVKELTAVNIDVIPKDQRATYRQQNLGDLEITQEHKQIILESVNETLKDPFTIPEK